jgi:hypothetical protein
MDKVNENMVSVDQQLEAQLNPDVNASNDDRMEGAIDNSDKHVPEPEPGLRVLSVGEWMLTIGDILIKTYCPLPYNINTIGLYNLGNVFRFGIFQCFKVYSE